MAATVSVAVLRSNRCWVERAEAVRTFVVTSSLHIHWRPYIWISYCRPLSWRSWSANFRSAIENIWRGFFWGKKEKGRNLVNEWKSVIIERQRVSDRWFLLAYRLPGNWFPIRPHGSKSHSPLAHCRMDNWAQCCVRLKRWSYSVQADDRKLWKNLTNAWAENGGFLFDSNLPACCTCVAVDNTVPAPGTDEFATHRYEPECVSRSECDSRSVPFANILVSLLGSSGSSLCSHE